MAVRSLTVAAFALLALVPAPVRAATPTVLTAHVDGTINSVMAGYLEGAVQQAQADHDRALVLLMNTPGGDLASMDQIITTLLNSRVPVIAYVTPPGARADSAGLFVAQSADVVAMAPGTNIGSAHPIASTGANIGGDLEKKIVNDAAATIGNLASIHGRNAAWAVDAVRNSVNVGVAEAVRLHVADLESDSLSSLLQQANGRVLHRLHGATVVLATSGASVRDYPMTFAQQLLNVIVNPDIAFVLILIAVFGILGEVTAPGAVGPGTVGAISAVLALIALVNLPVDVAGILLILVGFGLFLADIKAATHGVLSLGGVIALVLGGAFLFNMAPYGPGVDPWLILAAAGGLGLLFAFFVSKVVAARRRRPYAGLGTLVGSRGVTRTALTPEGTVQVGGVLWHAVAVGGGDIPEGEDVQVLAEKGLKLEVAPALPAGKEESAWVAG